ncbi:MAG: class I poly(R)-hydroxyalkanoic acid synthase, partial [Alphaproteobacteria bacterium]|nr:class I poly(R)-hydroxyalkanoic acid synthase [Alphaproteobacteria bacterium]
MTDKTPPAPSQYNLADPVQFAQNMAKVFEQAAAIARSVAERPELAQREAESQITPMEQVSKTLGAVAQSYMSDPQKLMDAQMQLWNSYTQLWQNTWAKILGQEAQPVAEPARSDKRFKDRDWQENTVFDFLKQFYLISANWAQDLVQKAEGLDDHTRHKARFYVEQIANAISPSNFALTNPEVLRATIASNGANLIEGLKNLEADMKRGDGKLRIKQTDMKAFEIGKNIA